MALASKIFGILSAAPAITAIVGTRIYPDVIPDGQDFPALRYAFVSGNPIASLGGHSGLSHVHFQIDAYAWSYAEAEALADAVVAAIGGLTGSDFATVLTLRRDLGEPEEKLYRAMLTFSAWAEE